MSTSATSLPGRRRLLRLASTLILAPSLQGVRAQTPDGPQCVAPARAGGGFDLSCRLLQRSLGLVRPGEPALRVTHMPGGIGAAAYNTFVTQRPAEGDTLVAFSGGSLLSLAQGRFGHYDVNDVRWVGTLGMDYGVLAVRQESSYGHLRDLIDALKRDPAQVLFGGSGTIGGQDWMKAALVARMAGVAPREFRYVGFEGGGEAFTALRTGYVSVLPGGTSEAVAHGRGNALRVLAVLAPSRLPGPLAGVPTAREQGFDIVWPNVRGFYMGPQVADADFERWIGHLRQLHGRPEFTRLRAEAGLYPFARFGEALHRYVYTAVIDYTRLAQQFELAPPQ